MSDPTPTEGPKPPPTHAPEPAARPVTEGEEDEDRIDAGPPRGWRVMAIVRWGLVAIMAILAVASIAYYFGKVPSVGAHETGAEYYCPMHPTVRQDHPGECPICSMTLVRKTSGDAETPSVSAPAATNSARTANPKATDSVGDAGPTYFCPMHPDQTSTDPHARCPICGMKMQPKREAPDGGTTMEMVAPALSGDAGVPDLVPVDLSMDRIQLMGTKTASVTREALVSQIRTVGVVSATEDGLAKVHARFAGWIQQLFVNETGQHVSRGQVLAVVYSPQVLVAEQEYLSARRWATRTPDLEHGDAGVVSTTGLDADARGRLELLGIAPQDITQLEKTGVAVPLVSLRAQTAGVVLQKDAVQGMYFQPGTELFTIADLSRVWLVANVYENEIARVRIGQKAHAQIRALSGSAIDGTVSFIYPTLNAETRTLRVRVSLPNGDGRLRPGMFGDVLLDVPSVQSTVIPGEALIDTGEHQYVFVAKEGGHFEPRPVEVGERVGAKVEILAGLVEGETVVTTGNFLLDSESRLRAVIEQGAKTAPAGAGPGHGSSCDADIDKSKFPDKYQQCRSCEVVHHGMGTMEEDCKNAIPKPWR